MQAGFDEQSWWNDLLGGNTDPALAIPDDVWDTAVATALDAASALPDGDIVPADQPTDRDGDDLAADDENSHAGLLDGAGHHDDDTSAHNSHDESGQCADSDHHAGHDHLNGDPTDVHFVQPDENDIEF